MMMKQHFTTTGKCNLCSSRQQQVLDTTLRFILDRIKRCWPTDIDSSSRIDRWFCSRSFAINSHWNDHSRSSNAVPADAVFTAADTTASARSPSSSSHHSACSRNGACSSSSHNNAYSSSSIHNSVCICTSSSRSCMSKMVTMQEDLMKEMKKMPTIVSLI